MRLILRLQSLNFRGSRRASNPEVLGALTRALKGSDLGGTLKYLVKADAEPERFKTLAQLTRESEGIKGAYHLASDEQKTPAVGVHVSRAGNTATVLVDCREDYVKEHASSIVSELIGVVERLHDALGPEVLLGPIANLEIVDEPYPRPRPPRLHGHFPPGTAATIVCPEFHSTDDAGDPEDVERLLAATPPRGVEKVEHGGLVIFRWVDDLSDEKKVRRARQAQEAWINEVLDPPVETGFNDEGDQQVVPLAPEPHPPLTVYDSFAQEGYKALVVRKGAKLDEKVMKDVGRWAADGALPDGTPLQRISLVLPNRRAALEIRDRALEAGAHAVVYSDSDGTFWNPFPPGEWAE